MTKELSTPYQQSLNYPDCIPIREIRLSSTPKKGVFGYDAKLYLVLRLQFV